MARVLLLIVLVWILYLVIKRAFFSARSGNATPPDSKSEQKPEQKFIQCAACGMHVPESETIKKGDLVICKNPDCNKNN